MTLSKMNDFTFKHSDEIDALYTQYTAAQIKNLFDSRGIELRTALNSLIDTLNSSDGASNIAATPIAINSGSTVQEQLAWLLTQISSAAMGTIPDGSIDQVKLSIPLSNKIDISLSNTGLLSTLITTDKSSAVNAINEIEADLNSHLDDNVKHITSDERTSWNAKTDLNYTSNNLRVMSMGGMV